MTRRELLKSGAFVGAGFALRLDLPKRAEPLRFATITDVHFGLAPDAYQRMEAFVKAVQSRAGLSFAVQLGDFCHPEAEAEKFVALWNHISLPKHHVLGNHDMDKGTKEEIMAMWGMPSRYHSFEHWGYRFIVLDLNHFKKEGGLFSYGFGNYFTPNATHNWADPEQLDWLRAELPKSKLPTFVLSHQPLGFFAKGQPRGEEQLEVLRILSQHNGRGGGGKVVACLCGHMHVDRLESYEGIPCLCLNSASYFWQAGMHAYKDPLFAFFEIGSDGVMRIEGVRSDFVKAKPATEAIGCSASIEDRSIQLSERFAVGA